MVFHGTGDRPALPTEQSCKELPLRDAGLFLWEKDPWPMGREGSRREAPVHTLPTVRDPPDVQAENHGIIWVGKDL